MQEQNSSQIKDAFLCVVVLVAGVDTFLNKENCVCVCVGGCIFLLSFDFSKNIHILKGIFIIRSTVFFKITLL